MNVKTILDLTPQEACNFFMRQDIYNNIPLPKYFNFSSVLDTAAHHLQIDTYDFKKASQYENTNYKIFDNKDGLYAWRPLQLLNPIIYVDLVNKITTPQNWKVIIERFEQFRKCKSIECSSIPIIADEGETTKESINNWWEQIEQKSIEMALFFDCCLQTDITDCYGSIYTHSIAWALHTKPTAKEQRNNHKLIGNVIDESIRCMSYGQTNGIPQGSVLMDFIAEIVLGYVDLELNEAIKKYNKENAENKIGRYHILRYRDDYRIFTYGTTKATIIAKLLTEVLSDLNLKLSTHKTKITTNIIEDSIKVDKRYWNESKQESTSLQKTLLLVHSLAKKYPNSGSVKKALDSFYDKVYPLDTLGENSSTKLMSSILIDIAYHNPKTYPIITAILGKILSIETDKTIVEEIYKAITARFDTIPNVGFLQIWLQRLTIKDKPEYPYYEKLCKKVRYNDIEIWNMDWLTPEQQEVYKKVSIIDNTQITEMPLVPTPKEIKVFNNNHYE